MQLANQRNMRAFSRVFQQSKIKAQLSARPIAASRYLSYSIQLAVPNEVKKALDLEEPLALAAGVDAVRASRVRDNVVYEFELPKQSWQTIYRRNLSSPQSVGLAAGGEEIAVEWGQEHMLFGGASGSGKTVAIMSAISALTRTYSAADLTILAATPHLHKDDWNIFDRLPHLAEPIVYRPDDITGLIDKFYRIYKRREESGSDGHKVALVLDECQHTAVLGRKKDINERNLFMIQQLATGCRGFDMRLIIGSQKPSQEDMPGILDNLPNRYVGLVTDASVSRQVSGQAGIGAHKLTGQGDFIHVLHDRPVRFQVAMIDDANTLPSGPANALPAMIQKAEEAIVNQTAVQSFAGDYHLFGRLVAYLLVMRRFPGSKVGKKEFDMTWRNIKAFRLGFLSQMMSFKQSDQEMPPQAAKWFMNWLSLNEEGSRGHG